MKDEKILKQIGKLLSHYGVDDKEKESFLNDLQNYKEEETEEKPAEEEAPVEEQQEQPVEEAPQEESPTEEPVSEESPVDEQTQPTEAELPTDEEQPAQEVANDSEEEAVEENHEEEGVETTTEEFDCKGKYEEALKTIEGLTARIESLEEVVSKLGKVEEDESIGASPLGTPVDEKPSDSFNEIMRKRIGY